MISLEMDTQISQLCFHIEWQQRLKNVVAFAPIQLNPFVENKNTSQ